MYLHRGICIYVCMCRCTCWIYKTLWNLVYVYGILRSFLLGCFAGIIFLDDSDSNIVTNIFFDFKLDNTEQREDTEYKLYT